MIPRSRYADRLRRLAGLVDDGQVQAALIAVGPDLDYLIGYRAIPLERLTMLAIVSDREPFLVVPRLEEPAARAGVRTTLEIVTWNETDDPHGLVADRVRRAVPDDVAPAIAVSDRLTAYHLLRLQAAVAGATWLSATSLLRGLRMTKDGDEVE